MHKQGFTFLELMVVLLILGLLAGIGVPAFRLVMPKYKRTEFITKINQLLSTAWQQALATQKIHQLHIDLKKHSMHIDGAIDQKGRDGKLIFKPINRDYLVTNYHWPETIQFKQFFVDGTDMMRGIQAEEIWFYIVPNGMVQPVVMNLIDSADETSRGEAYQFSLVVNPFTAQVATYDSFQKP